MTWLQELMLFISIVSGITLITVIGLWIFGDR